MYNQLKKLVKMLAAVTAAGILYYFITTRLGIAVPCIFHKITGFYCPGCGVTRMCIHLINLDFYRAFRSNPGVFLSLPLLIVIFSASAYSHVRYGKPAKQKWLTVLEIITAVMLIIFGILRNIPFFSFLAPI
ncbi:DUF2752 domain-containing protein [Porcipelethomonas sp.]|uniref:DUF2752 domain-containing protein n=1 Tax=Porcipelethomonas sp. TaxID=2981675 RepID=UPI003EFA634A